MAFFNSNEIDQEIKELIKIEINNSIVSSMNSHLVEYRNIAENILSNMHKMIDQEIQEIENLSQIIEIKETISTFNNLLIDLETENKKLHNEIKKRDAIIERKTKQIARLKEKNGI
jgi:predicted nuclease with TOPRIM domain